MKLLFIARTFPPLVGGMEKFANDFYHVLKEKAEVTLIANTIGKKQIVVFFFKVMVYLVFNARKFDNIHFNDAILSPLILIIRLFSSTKVTFTVHGLDIVYNKFAYQKLVIPFLRKADLVIPVSQHTKNQCLRRHIPNEKLLVIPNGLNFSIEGRCSADEEQRVKARIGINTDGKTVLLSLGRLIKRKGHLWFIEHVFAKLSSDYIYIIAGAGPEFDQIDQRIHELNLDQRVILLGYVSDDEKDCLFKLSDLFIMPNIHDENDQEGFGIVLLEAGSHGLPAIASKIEGIPDAVIDGVTGILVEEENAQGFIDAIKTTGINRYEIRRHIQNSYDWTIIGQRYYDQFKKLIQQNGEKSIL